MRPTLLIVGASARAAAFSALRAGLQLWCADCFADVDLRVRCAGWQRLDDYPAGLGDVFDHAPPGPWMYTGGLENYPDLIEQWQRARSLWGNSAKSLRRVRSPFLVAKALACAGLPCLEVASHRKQCGPRQRWLVKPLKGSAGLGIHPLEAGSVDPKRRDVYFQEYVDGLPCSAVFVGEGRRAELIGCSLQLIGVPWLHAPAFRYAGNIGPVMLGEPVMDVICRIGETLCQEFELRGLFGVDFILHDGKPFVTEVNPRYPASVELLEFATGLSALALHRRVFDPLGPLGESNQAAFPVVGKAILYARKALIFPSTGPWEGACNLTQSIATMPSFADVPDAGESINVGQPILTIFAGGFTVAECEFELQAIAASLDPLLFGR